MKELRRRFLRWWFFSWADVFFWLDRNVRFGNMANDFMHRAGDFDEPAQIYRLEECEE